MADPSQAQKWLDKVLEDGIREFALTDATIAYTLIHRALRYYRAGHKLQLNDDFVCWIEETLRDVKKKLKVDDCTLADVLLAKGVVYHLRAVARAHLKEGINAVAYSP